MIDWHSDATHALWNPRLPEAERMRLQRILAGVPPLSAHVWIATSGTTGALKLTALSKAAIRASAEAVNERLSASSGDVWCCVLPTFHVGGLGIHARAALSGSRVVSIDWDPDRFVRTLASEQVTLTALVPAQLRDLVAAGLTAPRALRAVIVGGGSTAAELYHSARRLGWPVMPSYGMTECASQVATATLDSPELVLLSHVECRIQDGRIALRSPSLLTGYASMEAGEPRFTDPKIAGWFLTSDRGSLQDGRLMVRGREGDFIKVGGESVDLARLDAVLDSVRGDVDAAVVAVPDGRLGAVIHLAVAGQSDEQLRERFNAQVAPFERARRTHRVQAIPRSSLGKLLRKELLQVIEPSLGGLE